MNASGDSNSSTSPAEQSPKKILIFSLAYYPKFIGGAEVAIKEITDRIDPGEMEFHLVTNRYDSTLPKVEKIGNVLVYRIGITSKNPTIADLGRFPLHFNKLLFQFLAPIKAARLHATHSYDGIWAMMAHACGVPAALFKMTHPRVPYLLTLQEGDPPEYVERKMRSLWPLFTRAFTKADSVQAISTFLAEWARARGFRGPLEVVPNAVDIALFTKEHTDAELKAAREKVGKKGGDVFLITTSRIVHKNAVDDVISALPHLPENVHFAILGEGPDEKALRLLATKLQVEKRVHFLGFVEHKEMPKYLKVCDIFVRPSRSEGMGNSFIEAMAAGLPVIATQEGGIADFLYDAKRDPGKPATGWAVDKDSPEQVAEAVKRIVADPEESERVIRGAKDLVLEKYDWDIIARDMREKVLKPLIYKG